MFSGFRVFFEGCAFRGVAFGFMGFRARKAFGSMFLLNRSFDFRAAGPIIDPE